MPQIRQQFTIHSLANIVSDVANVNAFSISNIQITYQLINFGQQIVQSIMSMPKFLIKSEGWSNSATTLS